MDNRFIKDLVSKSLYPTLQTLTKGLGDRIEKAIQSKDSPTAFELTNADEVHTPIVEGLKDVENAIREQVYPTEVSVSNMEKIDLTSLEEKLDALKEVLVKKEMNVNIGKTEVDTKSVVKAIEKLQEAMPKMEKQVVIDYTLILDELCSLMEQPHYAVDILRIQDTLNRLATTEDMGAIASWLEAILKKEHPEFPNLAFDDQGRLKVSVDKVGGGGMGLTQIEAGNLQTISESVPIDPISGGRIGLSTNHFEIHNGNHYIASGQATLASGASLDVLITVPSGIYNHFLYKVRVNAEANVTLYEAPTVSANGTLQSAQNRNRQSTNTADTTIHLTPTVTGVGTLLRVEHIGNGQTVGGDGRDENEWIFNEGLYLLRITSEAANNDVSWIVDWYEN